MESANSCRLSASRRVQLNGRWLGPRGRQLLFALPNLHFAGFCQGKSDLALDTFPVAWTVAPSPPRLGSQLPGRPLSILATQWCRVSLLTYVRHVTPLLPSASHDPSAPACFAQGRGLCPCSGSGSPAHVGPPLPVPVWHPVTPCSHTFDTLHLFVYCLSCSQSCKCQEGGNPFLCIYVAQHRYFFLSYFPFLSICRSLQVPPRVPCCSPPLPPAPLSIFLLLMMLFLRRRNNLAL